MFHRIDYEQWTSLVPFAAFFVTFGVFVYFVVRAVRLSRKEAEYMAQLPLQEKPEFKDSDQ
ncbi:MAG: hypothetical protein AAGH89_06105 [Verrucomicrobiota bacterium]